MRYAVLQVIFTLFVIISVLQACSRKCDPIAGENMYKDKLISAIRWVVRRAVRRGGSLHIRDE